jgi:hypothetical protein
MHSIPKTIFGALFFIAVVIAIGCLLSSCGPSSGCYATKNMSGYH